MAKIKKIVDQAYDYLINHITSGAWPVGSKIPPENELAEHLGISRMTLRTAIQKTNALGLTETKQGDGTYVTSFNMSSYFQDVYRLQLASSKKSDFLLFRNYMEIGSIRTAFDMPDFDQKVAHLREIYTGMVRTLENHDLENFHTYDEAFHGYVCSLSENQFIQHLYSALDSILPDNMRQMAETLYDPEHIDILLEPHKMLIEAMERRDIEGCFQAKFKHLAKLKS